MNTGGRSSYAEPPPPRATFTELESSDTLTLIALSGELDLDGMQLVETPLTTRTAARRRPVIIDVSAVSFIGSYALGVLVGIARACSTRRLPFSLVGTPEKVQETIRLARLEGALISAPTLNDALRVMGLPER